jgi:CDP-paratose 2-epimerase
VVLFDNLSRAGSAQNFEWLRRIHRGRVRLDIADVRDCQALRSAVADASEVYHFAAQVAVTSSFSDPSYDFNVNAGGTLNLLEELRRLPDPPLLLFTSTNKVYGSLRNVPLRLSRQRWEPADPSTLMHGVGENQCLEFLSPYGCSKGAADQYVLDYSANFGIPAVVFRMSCIYGPHQNGSEDQGWLAHFLICAMEGRPITIFGDGMQSRDVLYVEDLVDAMLLARSRMTAFSGSVFNIGGGPRNSISLIDLLQIIAEQCGKLPHLFYGESRPGDQRYYASDTRSFQSATGWTPRVGVEKGVASLQAWLAEARGVVTSVQSGAA